MDSKSGPNNCTHHKAGNADVRPSIINGKFSIFSEVALNFFTDNEKLDSLELLHVPLKKLKTLFPEQDVQISVPINFLVERYKVVYI